MNTYHNRKKYSKKRVAGVIFSLAVAGAVAATQPLGAVSVLAAPLEDCDLDGYDDATGVKVPWPGYDETKGDTPDGPGGGSSKGGSSGSSSGSSSSSSSSSGSSSESSAGSGESSSSSASSASSSGSSSAQQSSSSGGTSSSSKTSSTKKTKTSKTKSKKTTSSVKKDTAKDKSSSEKSTEKKSEEETEEEIDEEEKDEKDKDEETVEKAEKKSDNKKEEKEYSEDETKEDATDVSAVLSTGGTITVDEADGSLIHVGSRLKIAGSGFAGNVPNLKIEIHSDHAISLTEVSSAEDGTFQAEVSIPNNLEAGKHEIVLLYQGQQIAAKEIEVGPKVADSFLQALTVGFTTENAGLIPGIIVLSGLAAIGILVTVFSRVLSKKKK